MAAEEGRTGAEAQLAGHFERFEPARREVGRALRAKLRARLPGLSEVVYFYESKRSLVIAYSPTGNGYEALCSLAVEPDAVKLYFARGPELSQADPSRLLQGRGKVVRFVVLEAAADLARAEIEALLAAALELSGVRLDPKATGAIIIKAEGQRKRARR